MRYYHEYAGYDDEEKEWITVGCHSNAVILIKVKLGLCITLVQLFMLFDIVVRMMMMTLL